MGSAIEISSQPPSGSRTALPDMLLTLAFVAMYFVQLAHHQMWRDELNAWAIAVASPTIPSLFHHIHYEGHPWVWYILLWIPARFTASPDAMKVVQGMIGTGIYLLIGVASPFSRLEKLLLFLSYFVSFEYTVMSRMYGAAFLLALLYIRRRSLHPERVIGNSILLGLIASTDLIGVIISGGLLCEYAYTLWSQRRTAQQPTARTIRLAVLAYAVLFAFSFWSLKPTSDVSWRTTPRPFVYAASLSHLFNKTVTYTTLAFFPVQFRLHGWHYWWNADFNHHRAPYLAAFPIVLAALYLCFRRRTSLLIGVGLTLLAAIAYGHFIYDLAGARHYGMTFVVFLCALWLLRSQTPRLPAAALFLLGISAAAGVIARVGEWRNPFSNAENAAGWIQQHNLQNQPLAGYKDTSAVPVAELLERPLYQPECQCIDTFLLFGSRRDHFTEAQLPGRIAEAFPALHTSDILFIKTDVFTPADSESLARRQISIEPLAQFTGAQALEEDFYLYHLHQTP